MDIPMLHGVQLLAISCVARCTTQVQGCRGGENVARRGLVDAPTAEG